MKIQIKESLLRGLIKESIKKVLKEELNQLHDNGIDHFIKVIGEFVKQYKNCLDTPKEKSAQINLELQLTTNPDYTIKKIFNEYGINKKFLESKEGIEKFAFETFPQIVNDYSNFKQKNNINEVFGFSQKEKDSKQLKNDIIEALNEIDRFKFKGLFYQPGNPNDKVEIKRGLDIRLKYASDDMPMVTKLLPELFVSGGASPAKLEVKPGDIIDGFVPASFYYIRGKEGFIEPGLAMHSTKTMLHLKYRDLLTYTSGKFSIGNYENY